MAQFPPVCSMTSVVNTAWKMGKGWVPVDTALFSCPFPRCCPKDTSHLDKGRGAQRPSLCPPCNPKALPLAGASSPPGSRLNPAPSPSGSGNRKARGPPRPLSHSALATPRSSCPQETDSLCSITTGWPWGRVLDPNRPPLCWLCRHPAQLEPEWPCVGLGLWASAPWEWGAEDCCQPADSAELGLAGPNQPGTAQSL